MAEMRSSAVLCTLQAAQQAALAGLAQRYQAQEQARALQRQQVCARYILPYIMKTLLLCSLAANTKLLLNVNLLLMILLLQAMQQMQHGAVPGQNLLLQQQMQQQGAQGPHPYQQQRLPGHLQGTGHGHVLSQCFCVPFACSEGGDTHWGKCLQATLVLGPPGRCQQRST